MTDKPEQYRLRERLFGYPNRRLLNFQITRGDGPATTEEICGELNRAMDEREAGRLVATGPARCRKPPVNVRELVAGLCEDEGCPQSGTPHVCL